MNAPGPVAWQARVKRFLQLEASRDFGFAIALGLLGIFLLLIYQPAFVLAPGKHLPDGGQSLHNFWMTAHGIRMWKAFSLASYFDGNEFYPFGQVLAFSDHLLSLSTRASSFDSACYTQRVQTSACWSSVFLCDQRLLH